MIANSPPIHHKTTTSSTTFTSDFDKSEVLAISAEYISCSGHVSTADGFGLNKHSPLTSTGVENGLLIYHST